MSDIPTIKLKNKTLGVALLVSVPADANALIEKFGADTVYRAATRQTFYGPWNTTFRKALCLHLEELTGVKRRQKKVGGVDQVTTKKDGTTTPVLESEDSYIKFLLEENHITRPDYEIAAQNVADTVEFKMSAPGSDDEPDEEFLLLARQVLAKVEAGALGTDGNPITEESFVSKITALNPGLDIEALGGFTELGIARAIEINVKRIKAAQASELL